jgi:hypothetical protein
MRQNYKHSEQTKRKIGLANKGRIPPKEVMEKAWAANKGRHHSAEAKKRIGAYWRGKKRKSHPAWNKGLKGSVPWNKDITGLYNGSKSPHWKGGITPENNKIRTSIETRLWREAVFARDNWTCKKYNIRGGKLHSHHVKNFNQFPELRFAINNGVTLSDKAHKEFHKKYGRQNNNEKQLQEFLNKKNI